MNDKSKAATAATASPPSASAPSVPTIGDCQRATEARPLAPSEIGLKEFTTRHHTTTLRRGLPFEAVKDPALWVNVAQTLRQGDMIDVHAADGSFFGQLYVRDIGSVGTGKAKHSVRVHVLNFTEFDPIETHARPPVQHEVRFLGPNQSWGIVSIADGKVVVANLPDRDQAEQRLRHMAA